jgi:hypothetical protein
MDFKDLLQKAVNLTLLNSLGRKNFIAPNLYLCNLNKAELNQVNKILFYFDCPMYMHLGDHIFFLPLIESFILSGYTVHVMPTKNMLPVFKVLKLPVVSSFDIDKYDLIISRIEIIADLYKHKSLLVNVSKNLSKPICDQLLTDFGMFFNLSSNTILDYTLLKDNSVLQRLNIPGSKKIILFSLSCDTAAYLINQKKINLLLDLVSEYATNPDYVLALVGGADDRNNYIINFNFIDLRGKTSVLDIFKLVNCDNVFCYIGFDTFIMHVFSLLHKPSFVVFRGRLIKKQHDMLKKYHVNLFSNHNYVTLLN